jgi:hypothetical protein
MRQRAVAAPMQRALRVRRPRGRRGLLTVQRRRQLIGLFSPRPAAMASILPDWMPEVGALAARMRAAGYPPGDAPQHDSLALQCLLHEFRWAELDCDEFLATAEAAGNTRAVEAIKELRRQGIILFCPDDLTPNPCAWAHREGGAVTAKEGKAQRLASPLYQAAIGIGSHFSDDPTKFLRIAHLRMGSLACSRVLLLLELRECRLTSMVSNRLDDTPDGAHARGGCLRRQTLTQRFVVALAEQGDISCKTALRSKYIKEYLAAAEVERDGVLKVLAHEFPGGKFRVRRIAACARVSCSPLTRLGRHVAHAASH